MKESVKILEVAGMSSAIKGMRLPTKTRGDSISNSNTFSLGKSDSKLSSALLNKEEHHDCHAKFQRGIVAWLEITMPIYLWSEIDTYTIGMLPISSESTMYTLKKELGIHFKGNGSIYEAFSTSTAPIHIANFIQLVSNLEIVYGSINAIPIHELKAILPSGWMQKRVRAYTYQTLRRIYEQRVDHRLPEWQTFCEAIKELPYAEELIFGKFSEDI